MLSIKKRWEKKRWKKIKDIFNESLADMRGGTIRMNGLDLNPTEFEALIRILKRIPGLKTLQIKESKIKELPPAIEELLTLEVLILMHNKISKVPKELGKLSNLKFLELSFNKLAEVPQELDQLSNLKNFGLVDNRLTALPDGLLSLPQLKLLTIENNNFSAAELTRIRHQGRINGVAFSRRRQNSAQSATQPPSPSPGELSAFTNSGIHGHPPHDTPSTNSATIRTPYTRSQSPG